MTLGDLVSVYRDAFCKAGAKCADTEGIRAVVEALRDVFADAYERGWGDAANEDWGSPRRHRTSRACADDVVNEILASDGEVAGGPTREDGCGLQSQVTPSPAADFCEWETDTHPDDGSHYETKCGDGWNLLLGDPASDGYKFCPSCGKPIKFKEGSE
jgi:hypothetical protein